MKVWNTNLYLARLLDSMPVGQGSDDHSKNIQITPIVQPPKGWDPAPGAGPGRKALVAAE
jgi:hypothetical protein